MARTGWPIDALRLEPRPLVGAGDEKRCQEWSARGAIVTKAEFEISVFQMLIQRCAVFGTQGSKSRPNRARS